MYSCNDENVSMNRSLPLFKQRIEHLSTYDIGNYDKNFSSELVSNEKNQTKDISIRNALNRLIALYKKTGFLYPEKNERISPYMELILNNWQAALKLDDQLLNIIQFKGKNPLKEQLTTISFWRTTFNSWIAQHLASTGFPVGVCAMMLRAQAEVNIEKYRYKSFQNWFSKSNKYANLIFGTLVKTIGKEYSSVRLYHYVGVEKLNKKHSQIIKIVSYQKDMQYPLYLFYCQIRGTNDADAEEMNDPDNIELDQLDQLYQKVGLRRKRYIWLAYHKNNELPVGAAIAYRGPFGLNFSLIENRCDLLVDPSLSSDLKEIVCHNLLSEASKAYFDSNLKIDFPISFYPVVTDDISSKILTASGSKLLREYNKSIWMQQAFEGWYNHIQRTYDFFLRKRIQKDH